MQLNPVGNRLVGKPNRRQRRHLRTTTKYLQISEYLNTGDADTLLLMRVGDLHSVDTGQQLGGQRWSRAHVVVGLTAGLRLRAAEDAGNRPDESVGAAPGEQINVSTPWMIRDLPTRDLELSITCPGLILIIDRRHVHLVDNILQGRVEPVDPIVKAVEKADKDELVVLARSHADPDVGSTEAGGVGGLVIGHRL